MAGVRTSQIDLHANGDKAFAFVAQPDDEDCHPSVVLIQEWWGIEAHIQDLAQKLAGEGFVVAVPDLYHGRVATEPDDARRMMMVLEANLGRAVQEIMGALEAVKAMPNVKPKKLGVMGFCLGGLLTYTVASRSLDLAVAVPFYGGGYDPTSEEVASVNIPILAIYGRQDESIPMERSRSAPMTNVMPTTRGISLLKSRKPRLYFPYHSYVVRVY